MHDNIVLKISSNLIQIDDKVFNEKSSKFNSETNNIQRRAELLKETYDAYIEYLLGNSDIRKY